MMKRGGYPPLFYYGVKNMFEKRRIKWQQQRIQALENEVSSLRAENKALNDVIERDKSTISIRQTELAKREEAVEKRSKELDSAIAEVSTLQETYHCVISDLLELKKNYSAEMREHVERIKRQ